MNTDPGARQLTAQLTLAQWFSPSFPVGGFSFSHGLEWMVQAGAVRDCIGFQTWLHDVVEHGTGRNDVLLLAAAYRTNSHDDLLDIDQQARALAPSAERLLESTEQGGSFVRTLNAVWQTVLPPLTYPAAIGAAARSCQLPLKLTTRMYLQAFVANLVSAAIRLGILGQTDGQRQILLATALCEKLCDKLLHLAPDSIGSSTFLADIATMKHETQYSRMFRT